MHHSKKNWFQASGLCRRMGMQLLTINSAEENLEVAELGKLLDLPVFWTAGSDLAESRRWVWSTTGKPIEKTFWRKREPSNIDERCIETIVEEYPVSWNDNDCNKVRSFICEVANTPAQEQEEAEEVEMEYQSEEEDEEEEMVSTSAENSDERVVSGVLSLIERSAAQRLPKND